jgi:hypothetical protein
LGVTESQVPYPQNPGPRLGQPVMIVVFVVAALAVASTAIVLGPGLAAWMACPHTCPSGFAPVGIERQPPGSTGCRPEQSEVCDQAQFESRLDGLTLAHLRFEVTNWSSSSVSGPAAPLIPLGAMAAVSVLDSTGEVVGVWNVSDSAWVSGSGWAVPTDQYVPVVLDTGLVSNATLANAEFSIILTDPYQGALGFGLVS